MAFTTGDIGLIDFADLSPLPGDEEAKRLQKVLNYGTQRFFCLVREVLPGNLLMCHIFGGRGDFLIRKEYLSMVQPLKGFEAIASMEDSDGKAEG